MDGQSSRNLKRFLRWIWAHRRVWSHLHMSGLAVRLDGLWITLWTKTVLADAAAVSSPLGRPVVVADDVIAFRIAVPINHYAALMADIWRGEIPAGRLRHVGVPLTTWCPPGVPPSSIGFSDRLSSSWSDPKKDGPEGWPRLEIDWGAGQLSLWAGNDAARYEKLGSIDRRFKAQRFGTIAELGSKLGFPHHANEFIYAPAKHWFSAPLPARLVSVMQDRAKNLLVASLEVGRLVSRDMLRVGLSQADGRPPRPALSVHPGRRRLVPIRIKNPAEGQAEVSLVYGDLGEIESLKTEVKPRFKPWPRSAVLSLIDPGLARLRADVTSTKPDEHERGVSLLLELLGYASMWWTQKLPQPAGSRSGKHAQDLVAFSNGNRHCLVVECKTDWLTEAKINTLVGRANAVAHRLENSSPGDSPWTRALLVVARPRHEIPRAVSEAIRKNQAGLMTIDDAVELLDAIEEGVPPREVHEKFENLFAFGGDVSWDTQWM
jgi:hypothetical protein